MKKLPRRCYLMAFVIYNLFAISYHKAGAQCTKEFIKGLQKSALVIGENNYSDEPLSNPINDAIDISKALYRLGFNPILDTNVDRIKLTAEIEKWTENLKNVDVAIFYFAGHGAEIDGQNYLYPTNAKFTSDKEVVKASTYLVSTLLNRMEFYNKKINVIILDACRDDPTRSLRHSFTSNGLRGMPIIKRGVLVGFPVAAGQKTLDGDGFSRNSIYTKAILNNIENPNTSITDIFGKIHDDVDLLSGHKQTPFINSSIGSENDFCIKYKDSLGKSGSDANYSDTIVSENLRKYRNDPLADADQLLTIENKIFPKVQEIIGLGIRDAWDSVLPECKCDYLRAFQDNNFQTHSFSNTDGFSSQYYRIEFRALIQGQINDNEFIFSIQSNGNRSDKLLPLEKLKGLNHEKVLVEPISAIDWDEIRDAVRKFFLLRVEMFK